MTDRRVALVTGTRTGIGRFLAERFVQQGYSVHGCSRSTAAWSLEGYVHHEADVSDEEAVRAMVGEIRRQHGRLDVAVNNAGVASMNHVLLTPGATVDRVLATNLRGTFLVCREAAKLMQRHRYGRIVNVSTVAVPARLAGEAIYAASKSAVTTFTQVMAREVAELGITCNVVGPGPIETDLLRGVPEGKVRDLVDRLVVKRLGRFEDVANVVDFFVRPESDYITGQVIYLGGLHD